MINIIRLKDLPEGSGLLSNDDILVFMDDPSGSGTTKKITFGEISNLIGSGTTNPITIVGGDYISSNLIDDTYTISVTGLQPSGNYSIIGHSHQISDVSGLQTALDSKQPSGIYASGIHSHSSSDITNFNSSVSGLLPVTNITAGSYISVSSSSGNFTVSATGLQPSGNYSISGHTHLSTDITDSTSFGRNILTAPSYAAQNKLGWQIVNSSSIIAAPGGQYLIPTDASLPTLITFSDPPSPSHGDWYVVIKPYGAGGLNGISVGGTTYGAASGVYLYRIYSRDTIFISSWKTYTLDKLHNHISTDITDFNSSVSGLLPSVSGSGYATTSFNNNVYTVSVTGVQPSGNYSTVGHTHVSSDITNFNSSVSGLLPVTNILSGVGISVSNSSGVYTIEATGSGILSDQAKSLVTTVFNKTGSPIPKMTAVYINGGQGDLPTVSLAIATSDMTSAGTYGLTYETIPNMQSGQVIVFGALTGLNTDQFNPTAPQGDVNGSVLYLSPSVSGSLTLTKPSAPNHIVAIGTIVRTHQNEGVIEVRVQNGFELEELHDVAISGIIDGQVLVYQTGINNLWTNTTLSTDYISDFNDTVNSLITVKDIVPGTGIIVLNDGSGNYNIATTSALNSVQSVNNQIGIVMLDKNDIGLSNVDNTSDLNKPISTATQNILDTKAPIDSPAFTGNVTGITKDTVGLNNVDNTSDLNKPISTATQNELNNKANIDHSHTIDNITNLQNELNNKQPIGSYAALVNGLVPASQLPSFVDEVLEFANQTLFPNPGASDKIYVDLSTNNTFRWSGSSYINISSSTGNTDTITEGINNLYFTNSRASAAAPVQSVNTKTGIVVLNKNDIGLNNVDNTSDINKPISTPTQNALNLKANITHQHISTDISDLNNKIIFNRSMSGRLSLESGAPISFSGVTSSVLYYIDYGTGNKVSLYDTITNTWSLYNFNTISLNLAGLPANSLFDIFLHNNAGTLTLSSVQWSSATLRNIQLARQDGVRVLSTDRNKRYLGTISTTSTAGQCEDSPVSRFVWNNDNQFLRNITRQGILSDISQTSSTFALTTSDLNISLLTGIGRAVGSSMIIDHSLGISASANLATDCEIGVNYNGMDHSIASASIDNTDFQLIRGSTLIEASQGAITISSRWRRSAGSATLRILGSSRFGYRQACTLTVYQWG